MSEETDSIFNNQTVTHKACMYCGLIYLLQKEKCIVCKKELKLYDF